MAKKKRIKRIKIDISKLFEDDLRARESQFKTPNASALEQILKQRHRQRDALFNFALFWTKILLILLISILVVQIGLTIFSGGKIVLIDKTSLSILSISILGQFIGVIIVIAKALWDDKHYKDYFKNIK